MLLPRLFFIEKHISFSCSTRIMFSKPLLLFFWTSGFVHSFWSKLSKLENDPASGYSLTPVIQIRIITPWIFYAMILVMYLRMRLPLSWFVIVLLWQYSIHSKLLTAVFLSRQLFPDLYSNIWFSDQSVISCPCHYWNSRCWLWNVSNLSRPLFSSVSHSFCTRFPFLLTCRRDIHTYVHLLRELYWLFLLPVLPRAKWIWLYSREIQFF